jgi:hypothetical protein
MALSKTITFKGVAIPDAYHRVFGVSVTKETVSFSLGVHASTDSQMLSSTSYACAYDLNGNNPIQQAYEHLKTLPEFAGAADV